MPSNILSLVFVVIYVQAVKFDQFPANPWTPRTGSKESGVYTDSWVMMIRGGPLVAEIVARRNGYENLGLVHRMVLVCSISNLNVRVGWWIS